MVTSDKADSSPRIAPGGLPFIGHALPMLRRPLRFIDSLRAHGGVVMVRLGHVRAYVVTDPLLLNEVLVPGDHDFARGRMFDKLSQIVGKGLATTSGPAHRRQRLLVQPVFRRDRFDGYLSIMRDVAENVTTELEPGQVVDVEDMTIDLALTVVTRSLFNTDMGTDAAAAVRKCLPVLARGMMVRTILPEFWGKIPTPGNRRYTRAVAGMDRAIQRTIASYRASKQDHGDLLSMLIAARDDTEEALSDQEIRDQVITFVIGGIENVAASLAWALYELGHHPHVEERLHAELDQEFGSRQLDLGSLDNLRYLDRVVNEVLRMHASVWILMRRTLRSIKLGDVLLPADAEIIFSPYAIQRDPRWFAEPLRFDPDRWMPDRARALARQTTIPFGAGVYKCIAHQFAISEMKTVLAVLCSRWAFRAVARKPIREVATLTVHPSRMLMRVERREA
ncbi:cytochrome P450 [Kibdelosporangium aridum]|uniref:cytochrome P450 n=1 Tax=Kibdelosporangium aridum TaxID=2030 RepID=UPI0007C522DA